jgi:mono/diheme cytochrome c family protein
MRLLLKIIGILVLVVLIGGIAFYGWASWAASRAAARTFTAHSVDFPVPFPLGAEEVASLGLTEEQARDVARQRAVERGRHLVQSRYVCIECHGANFSGGVMIDAPIMGRLLGPNITTGAGGRTAGYTTADWDRIVRHGIRPDGTGAAMPSEDFQRMSDQELSDIITYVQSQPAIDNTVPPPTFGPLGKILVATGQLKFSADVIASHDTPHPALPPTTEASATFGLHLAGICTGCHRPDFAGGPIIGGDPSWPPARNLTPHETGLGSWTLAQFTTAMRDSRRPDGTALLAPMTLVAPYAKNMTDVEIEALWLYLRSVPALPSRQ